MLKSNDQSSSWWGSPLQKQAVLLKEPHGYHETAYHRIPSSLNTNRVQTLCKKELLYHQELPSLKEDLTCKGVLPWQLSKSLNMQYPSLEITGVIRSKFPVNHRVHMLDVLDLVANLQWPATSGSSCCNRSSLPLYSCVSQDLLCFSWCTFLWMRSVHGIKQSKPKLTETYESHNYLWETIYPLRFWDWSSRRI